VYHVITRGNNLQAVFPKEGDYLAFLKSWTRKKSSDRSDPFCDPHRGRNSSKKMRKHRIIVLLTLVVVLTLTCFVICQPTGTFRVLFPLDYWVEFVVPNGFSGKIVIEEDPANGVDPRAQYCRIYTYHVPSSGELVVRSFALLGRPHYSLARYESGEAIATGSSGGKGIRVTSPQQTLLEYVGSITTEKQQIILFVGTISDYHKIRKQLGFMDTEK
jgi:hypothetical protein